MTLLPRASEQGLLAEARLASLQVRQAQPGWVPPPATPALPSPASPAPIVAVPGGPRAPEQADPPGPARTPDGGALPSSVADGAPPPSRAVLLPSPLRGGRWAPGRRGALALIAVAVLAAVLAAALLLRSRPVEVSAPSVERPAVAVSAPPSGTVVVAVAGKVRRPGVVRLPVGSRVDDALRAAGGVLAGTDPGLLNLARLLVDGEQVLVGVAGLPDSGSPLGAAPTAGGKVNLNTATVADLDALPGIGPVLAQHVVDWRTEHGRFASIDQLREVPGIGEAKYASLRGKVRV